MRIGLLLAAGRSRRFGQENKLLHAANGRPLIAYSVEVLRALELDQLIAVISDSEVVKHLAGFDIIYHPSPDQGLGSSLARGALRAQKINAHRLLVALGDMPFVTKNHCQRVLAQCTERVPSASVLSGRTMPPACFPQSMLSSLTKTSGSKGAQHLLSDLPSSALVQGSPSLLADIDTPAQWSYWRAAGHFSTNTGKE
ncbi:MAG: nucleotidyltransferase family protein [Pseudomonadota bacterium]